MRRTAQLGCMLVVVLLLVAVVSSPAQAAEPGPPVSSGPAAAQQIGFDEVSTPSDNETPTDPPEEGKETVTIEGGIDQIIENFENMFTDLGDSISSGFNNLKAEFNAFWDHLISQTINDFINDFTNNVSELIRASLFIESLEGISSNALSAEHINNALDLLYGVMVALLFLKFLWKGIKVYALWRDGDADVSPTQMYTNAIVAIVTALVFPTVYRVVGNIVLNLGTALLKEFPAFDPDTDPTWTQALGAQTILSIFYTVIRVILTITLLSQGIELFVLRMGVPIAVAGMVDSDGGVWKTYCSTMVKVFATCLVRYVLIGLSFRVIVSASLMAKYLAIALCITALRMPKILGQILIPGNPGRSGTMRTVMMAMRMFMRR